MTLRINMLDGLDRSLVSGAGIYWYWRCSNCERYGCVIDSIVTLLRQRDDPKEVEDILKTACRGFNINMFYCHQSVLKEAVYRGRVLSVKYLLQQPGIEVQPITMAEAIQNDNVQIVKAMLNHPDVDVGNFTSARSEQVVDLLLAHPTVDVNFEINTARDTVLHRWTAPWVFKNWCHKLLSQPDINANKHNKLGRSPLFNVVYKYSYPDADESESFAAYKFYLEDVRVNFAVRDNFGKTVYDYITEATDLKGQGEFDFWFDPRTGEYVEDNEGFFTRDLDRDLALLQHAETLRLRWAKKKVKILQEWSPCPHGRVVPDDVLSNYVLPFVADILSPMDTLGGSSLQ